MKKNREIGIVVYGATGYTGKLVAEYLNNQYGADGDINWAMAGRSLEKLEAVRDDLGVSHKIPLLVVDAGDPSSIAAMAEKAAVVISTVGPYQLYGSDLVAACAAAHAHGVSSDRRPLGQPSTSRVSKSAR